MLSYLNANILLLYVEWSSREYDWKQYLIQEVMSVLQLKGTNVNKINCENE